MLKDDGVDSAPELALFAALENTPQLKALYDQSRKLESAQVFQDAIGGP